MTHKKFIVWFNEVSKDDVGLVGGKGANLGEMVNAGFPVPYGFIITAKAFFYFIEKNKLRNHIYPLLKQIDYNRPEQLQQVSFLIQEKILSAPIPADLEKKIIYCYDHLIDQENKFFHKREAVKKVWRKIKSIFNHPYVAIRSSATAEDLPTASFAGQQETYLNVRGEINLIKKVKEGWASLFTPRSIYYRHQQGFAHEKVGIAIVVQRMIQSEKSGIAFTVDPITNNKNKMVIEAIFGLGEYIVGGKVTPDHYEIDKQSLVITKKDIQYQKVRLVKKGNGNVEEIISKQEGYQQKLSDKEILELALIIKDIEKHYYFPQDIEWAIEDGEIFIVQSRPITTLSDKKTISVTAIEEKPILIGAPASPGIGYGPVKKLHSPKEIDRVQHGDVLVASQTNPDYVPAMKKAAAIVTERGGRTSHAAIVSRELGIPAVVGAEGALKILKDEQIITVNGSTGEIYLGKVVIHPQHRKETFQKLSTKTKIYVNLAEVEEIKKVAHLNIDGVGLLRAEFMIAEIGIHPKTFIKNHQQTVFINRLFQNLLKFARAFYPKPVIYRATDFKTNEYRHLKNGIYYEPKEENPMLGYRGAYRYIHDTEVFLMELEAIKKVYHHGFNNVHLMIPFIRAPWELIKIKKIVEKAGLTDFKDFILLMMVEVPATALKIEEFLQIGVDGLSIGSNDLTMMLLGVDRDNSEVANLYDERDPIVLETIKYVISEAKKYHTPVSICGQAPSDYPEIVEELVKAGITSISVNPDAIERTRKIVYEVERKLGVNKDDHD